MALTGRRKDNNLCLNEIAYNTVGGITSSDGNIATVGGATVNKGAGTTGTGTLRVVLPTDQSSIPTAVKQYSGTPSNFAIASADGTVFTLAAGEIGFIQNLSADAPLAVKKGASASAISLSFILAASTADSDGTGGAVEINDWVGAVSVAKMTGTAKYLAWKQAP